MDAHITYMPDETGADTDVPMAYIHPASAASVEFVMKQPTDGQDGRSGWVWLRLANGDLMLGVFPQGDTYLSVEDDAQFPYDKVRK